MGLLDMLQADPDKKEALRQGLLSAGIQMLMGGRQGFGESLGQGLGAGVGAYQKEFDATKRKIAMQQSIQAATTPSRPAVPTQYGVQDQRFNTQAEAQSRANPYNTSGPSIGQPEQLMPGMASVMNGEIPEEQPLMSPQQDVSMPGQQVGTYPGQEAQAGGFDFSKFAQAALSDPNAPPELQDMAMKYYASQKPAEIETVVVGRTLKNKRTGETIGYDETWNDDKIAQREQRMDEIKLRLADQKTNREQQMELRRELADQQAALRRDLSEQAGGQRQDALDMRRDELAAKSESKKETLKLTKQSQVASFDTMLGTLDRLGKHPGLARSVGVMGVLPTMPGSDSANFQAELNTFQSQAFVPMVAQLKGMGALSDAEGKKLTAAVGALDPKMGEKAFRESVSRITSEMSAARERVSGQPSSAGGKSNPPKGMTVTLSDIAATAKASGKTTEQVTKAFRAKGYQIR